MAIMALDEDESVDFISNRSAPIFHLMVFMQTVP